MREKVKNSYKKWKNKTKASSHIKQKMLFNNFSESIFTLQIIFKIKNPDWFPINHHKFINTNLNKFDSAG